MGLAQGHIHHRAEAPKLRGELVDCEWKGQVLCLQSFMLSQGRVCMPEPHLVKAMCSNCYILVILPDLVSTGEWGDPFGEILSLMSVAGQPGLEKEFVELLRSDRIPSTTPGADPPRDARDSGSARSHSMHLETSSSD